jgi:PAS domain S-box-containing protein
MSFADRVAQHAPLLLVYLDQELRVQYANLRCDEFLGCPAEEIRGRLLAELVDEATLRHALAHVAELERGEAAPREYLLRDKEGGRRAVHVHAATERDADGRPIGYLACARTSGANFSELVARAVCTLYPFAAERGVRVELRAEHPGTRVAGDERSLDQAVARLVGAAIERSAPGQLVRVLINASGDRASLAVYDECRTPVPVSHIGVSIARACVVPLEGSVSVASSEAGAAFRVDLPRLGATIAKRAPGAP